MSKEIGSLYPGWQIFPKKIDWSNQREAVLKEKKNVMQQWGGVTTWQKLKGFQLVRVRAHADQRED